MALAEYTVPAVTEPEVALGTRIRQERKRKHLQQIELGHLVGVSRALIGKWENGDSVPDVIEAKKLALIFEVSFGWLCGVDAQSRWSLQNSGLAVLSTAGELQLTLPFPPELQLVHS